MGLDHLNFVSNLLQIVHVRDCFKVTFNFLHLHPPPPPPSTPPPSTSTPPPPQVNEKEIASRLRWNLSAVTAYDFIEELSQHLSVLLAADQLEKLVDHSHTLANVCLLCKSC